MADRIPGGARKEAWFIDIERADGTIGDRFSCAMTARPPDQGPVDAAP